jgi:hypothetical protein
MLSEPMIADLGRNGVDFRVFKQKPCTVYVTLPADRLVLEYGIRPVETAKAVFRLRNLTLLFMQGHKKSGLRL